METSTTTRFITTTIPQVQIILTDLNLSLWLCLDCDAYIQDPTLDLTGHRWFGLDVEDDFEEHLLCSHCHSEALMLVRPALDNESLQIDLSDEVPF